MPIGLCIVFISFLIRKIRAVHSMGNWMRNYVIERLTETENSAEALAYPGRLKKEWQELHLRSGQEIRLR